MSGIKTHYSAAELAEMGLPGLPSTERNVRALADRAGWSYVEVPSRGRIGLRREYAAATLPAEARTALLARAVASVTPVAPPAPALPAAPHTPAITAADLTDRQRLERDARTGVLAAVRRLQAQTGCSQEAALTTLLTSARAGRLDAVLDKMLQLARDARGRKGDGYPSVRTLKRWLAAKDLAPRVVQRDMLVPAWGKVLLTHYQQPQKPSVQQAYERACADWTGEAFSVHQARRFLARLGVVTRERGRMGPRELKNIQPFVRRTFDMLLPNDVWSADGHTFDAEVQHPLHGRPFRPEITTFIDIATRRVVGWSVDLAESSYAVADALRNGVEHNGIPAILYVDNGSGYRNAFIQDEATGLLGRLGITIEHSLPYNSQARGVIERVHQTIWVRGARELPSYIGRAMDREARLEQFKLTRRALKAGGAMPLMPWHLFMQWCEEQVGTYNARPHRSLGGISPDAAWANHLARGWRPAMADAADLNTLFRPRVERVLARAEIRLFNNLYFSPALAEFHGMRVHVAYDIHDASRVWVYAPDGRLICEARVNGNTQHYFPVPVVEQARQKRAQRRLNRVDTKREEILAELHGGPALAAPASSQIVIGGRIVDPAAALAERRAVAEATVIHAEAVAPAAAASPQPAPAGDTPRPRSERSPAENYAEWLTLDEHIKQGLEVSDADARWHRTYQTSAQFRAQHKKTATGAATRVA